jgi:hypothetical protein
MRVSAMLLPLVAALGLAAGALSQEPDPEWKVNRLLWEGTRQLASDPAANAGRVISLYTSYLNLPAEENLTDLRARVLARRGEAYLARLDFTAAESDFRAANDLWPGMAREELDRTLLEPPSKPPGLEEEEAVEEESSSSHVDWADYYDIDDMKFEAELPFRVHYFPSFAMQKMTPSRSAKSDLDVVQDLGLSPTAVSGGLDLRLHLGDGVLWILEADLWLLKGEKKIEQDIAYGGELFSSADTVRTTMTVIPALFGFQFFVSQGKANLAFNLGARLIHETTTLEGTSHGSATNREFHYLPYVGITGAFDISEGSIHSVLDLNGFYWANDGGLSEGGGTLIFFQAGWEWGFRLGQRVSVFLGARLDYDDLTVVHDSGRKVRFAPVSAGGSLKLELRLF